MMRINKATSKCGGSGWWQPQGAWLHTNHRLSTLSFMLKLFCYISIAMFTIGLNAQHGNNWPMGLFSGIKFSNDGIKKIKTKIETDTSSLRPAFPSRSSVAFSDCNGKLVLYGNERLFWNQYDYVVKNSYKKIGANDYISSLLLPKPNSSRFIYYFGINYLNLFADNNDTFYCQIIDLYANNGYGEVIKKINLNNHKTSTLTYTLHANGKDIWVLQGYDDKTLYSFLLTDTGLVTTPVISNNVYSGQWAYPYENKYPYSPYRLNYNGSFNISNNRKTLISTGIDTSTTKLGCVWQYEFDNATGKASNGKPIFKFSEIPNFTWYGNINSACFSTNDTFCYLTSYSENEVIVGKPKAINRVWQYNMNTGKKIVVYSERNLFSNMQLGPDGKIYFLDFWNIPSNLYRISYPNKIGTNCKIEKVMNDSSFHYAALLPTVYAPYRPLYFYSNMEQSACVDTATFQLHVDTVFRQLTVYYGDGDSVVFKKPLKEVYNLKHQYKTNGSYYVQLKALNPVCESYTYAGDSFNFAIVPRRLKTQKQKTAYCQNSQLKIEDSLVNTTYSTYHWSNGSKDTLRFGSSPVIGNLIKNINKQNDTQTIVLKTSISNAECPNYSSFQDTFLVTFLPTPKIQYSLSGYATQTIKNNKLLFSLCEQAELIFKDTTNQLARGSWQGANSSSQYSNATAPIIKTLPFGNYTAIINDTNTFGCTNADTFYITAWQKPKPNFTLNNAEQCLKGNQFEVKNISAYIADSVLYTLYCRGLDSVALGIGNSANYQYANRGNYAVKLKATSSNNCIAQKDTFVIVHPFANAAFIVNSDTQCIKGNQFIFSLINPAATNCYWQFGDTNTANSNGLIPVIHSYNSIGNYSINNITNTTFGCKDTFAQFVNIIPSPQAQFTLNDTAQCLNGNNVVANINTQPSNSTNTMHWGNSNINTNLPNSNINHTYNTIGTYSIQLISSLNQCADTATKTINIYPHPNTQIQATDLCLGDSSIYSYTELINLPVANQTWLINNNIISQQKTIKQYNNSTIPFTISLKTSTVNNCENTETKTITIVEKPKAQFIHTRIGRNANGIELYFIDQSKNSTARFWQFENNSTSTIQNPKYTFADTGFKTIILIANNQNTCFDTLTEIIPVLDFIEFYFPTAFSPNNNGINDGFGLNANQHILAKEYHIEIYNRWGEKMFETNNKTETWLPANGTLGIYIYKAQVRDIYNVLHEFEGVVEVIM